MGVKSIKLIDKYFGYITCLFLGIFNFKPKEKEPKNILLIQLWGIGETILALPAIKELRKNKKAKIDILVTNRVKEIFYKNKDIDNVKVLRLNPFSIKWFMLKNFKKYDLVIDMEEYLNISSIIAFFTGKERIGYSHGVRSLLYTKKVIYNDRQHVTQTFMDLLIPLGIKEKATKLLSLNYSPYDKKRVNNLLKNKIFKKDFVVGLGIGAAESAKSRMWPGERFAKVADYLVEKYKAKIVFVGSKDEEKLINGIRNLMKNKNNSFNLAGKTSVREMFYLIKLCSLFIGNDSGPMHAAAAQKVRTIGLFGCNLPVRFAPFGKKNSAIRKQTGEPCINVHKREVGECKHGIDNACVKKIKVRDVINRI